MASTKRTSVESGEDDDQENEASDPLFQQEDNDNSSQLSPLSDTTLHDLPIEMFECILVKAIVMEVKGMKLAKSVWKEKADLVISRLRTVCSHWNNILTTDFFGNELHRTLDSTAHQTIRLEILFQCPMQFDVEAITTLKDEIFMLSSDYKQLRVNVFDRNSLTVVKDVIPLREGRASGIAACNVSDCLYVGLGNESCDCLKDCHCFSVLRIMKDEEHQFKVSPCIRNHKMPFADISVNANGSVMILSDPDGQKKDCDVVSIYDANGSLQHKIVVSLDDDVLGYRTDAFQKSNGNLVLVCFDGRTNLLEIDKGWNVVRQYRSSLYGQCNVTFGDIYGRIVITGLYPFGDMELLDSEFNFLEFSRPQLDEDEFCYLHCLHFNSDRNEVMCIESQNNFPLGLLTIFRFTEE